MYDPKLLSTVSNKINTIEEIFMNEESKTKKKSNVGMTIVYGLLFGVILSLIFFPDNYAIGIGIGLSLGIVVGAIMDANQNKKLGNEWYKVHTFSKDKVRCNIKRALSFLPLTIGLQHDHDINIGDPKVKTLLSQALFRFAPGVIKIDFNNNNREP